MNEPLITSESCRRRQTRHLSRFFFDEEGSATIESVIWLPIFALLLAFIMNVSIVFFNESQMLRVVQDGNRAFSLGRMEDAVEVENYILSRLAYLEADMTIRTTISGGVVMTELVVPAGNLMPLKLMSGVFDGVRIRVSAQQIVEF